MLVLEAVPQQIISLRRAGCAFTEVERGEALVFPQVHGRYADHGKTVSYIIYIDAVLRDRHDLSVPRVPVLDVPFQKESAGVKYDTGYGENKRQQASEQKDLE
jgi:hypothetical protein